MSILDDVEVGWTWVSKPHKIGYIRTLLFAAATCDWNRVHINPLTSLFYKSRLGGLVAHGFNTTARMAQDVHRLFPKSIRPEIVNKKVIAEYPAPLRLGRKFWNHWTLTKIVRNSSSAWLTFCVRTMTKDDTLIHESEWTIRYGQAEWAEWVIAVISMTQELKKKSRPVIATAALISYIFASAAIWSLNHRYGLDKPVPDCGWCGPGNGP